MEKREWSAGELLAKAERYCASAERCSSQVCDKLVQWGADEKDVPAIIEYLYADKYLDDSRFAHAYVHDKLLYQGWGRKKIGFMLSGLGINPVTQQEALASIDEQDYMRVLNKVSASKRSATREQRIRFLMQRGFLYEEIIHVL